MNPEELKRRVQALGEKINDVLGDSDELSDMVMELNEMGAKISLTMAVEAPSALIRGGEEFVDHRPRAARTPDPNASKITGEDEKFLKQLRIKLDDKDSNG